MFMVPEQLTAEGGETLSFRHTHACLKVSFHTPYPGLGWVLASAIGKEKSSKQLRVSYLYVLEDW